MIDMTATCLIGKSEDVNNKSNEENKPHISK